MFKNILYSLLKINRDELFKRIDSDQNASKQFNFMGGSIFFSLITILVLVFIMSNNKDVLYRQSFSITPSGKVEEIVTLPYPHQSIKNVQSWLTDAIMASYNFSFTNFDQQVASAEFYFLPEGYKSYLQALERNNIKGEVIGKQLKISAIPMAQPVSLNNGIFAGTEFWRFRVPVIISYYGGKETVNQKVMVEVLVLRVSPHSNHKALGIAEFNMI